MCACPESIFWGDEAEVDFGQVRFYLDDTLVDAWMFVMRLSASGKGFHRVYFNQAQEVFLDGHVRAFADFGGVPGRIRYDNLKPAVVRVMKGRGRIETERFIALRSHYGFESSSASPTSKGRMRRAASKEKSVGSAAAIWSRFRTSLRWRTQRPGGTRR